MGIELLRALDLPRELQPVQDAYWMAEREWEKLQESYAVVVADLVRRVEEAS